MESLVDLTYARINVDIRSMRQREMKRSYRITVLSNVLVNALSPVMEWMFLNDGISPAIAQANFDNIVQDSASIGDADAVVVFMDVIGFAAAMPNIPSLGTSELEELSGAMAANVEQVLKNLKNVPLVLFNRFSAMPYEGASLKGGQLGYLATRLNEVLDANAPSNVVPVSVDKVFASVGLGKSIDFRQYHSARSVFTLDFFKGWAEHVYPAFRSAVGHSRKVLVVDCDNTLWGGIIGEDGLDGIRLDETTVDGPFFAEAQQIMKGLKAQGVLLAIASKNNPEDVKLALARHPAMVLREEDFVVLEVSWEEKIVALKRIAETLNLGIDSLVFLDDSPFELERIRTGLPQVSCLQVTERPSDYPRMLRSSLGLFFNLSKSDEDAKRTQMYREEMVRKAAMTTFESQEEYLASLKVEVDFAEGNAVNLARAAQMSQKTNQFNLTTRRYTEADMQRMTDDQNMIVTTFSVRDRFGDYGITGLVILSLEPGRAAASLDTFLMSCRVLGRRVEDTVMDWIRQRLAKAACASLAGEYLATAKNAQVADLLDRLGFARAVG